MNTTLSPAQEVREANPDHLSSSAFLVKLALAFNVLSIPLAIFLLIVVIIACILFVIIVLLIVRSCMRSKHVVKQKKKPFKSIYLDQVPGMGLANGENGIGILEYSLEYHIERSELVIGVIQVNEGPALREVEMSDAYVTVGLYKIGNPPKRMGKLNKTYKKTSGKLLWKEFFTYHIENAELSKAMIQFEVFIFDTIRQETSFGKLDVHMKDMDIGEYTGNMQEMTGTLVPGADQVDGIGELCVGLGYFPLDDRLDVTIYEAKQLRLTDILSPFKKHNIDVLVELKMNSKVVKSIATHARMNIFDPYFNEKMSFPVRQDQVESMRIDCSLRKTKRIGGSTVLGIAPLGSESTLATGVKQWEEMIEAPKIMHAKWHKLLKPGYDSE